MSETTNLKLFKHDNPSTNKNLFDITKSLNDNWDKIDTYVHEQEAERQTDEETRQNQEKIRQTNETTRQSNESARKNAENTRNTSEEARVANEETRKIAETAREEYITELKARVNAGEFKGDPNVLKIGKVEKGDNAQATIEGNSPNQTLNLILPKGDKGDKFKYQDLSEDEKKELVSLIDANSISFADGETYQEKYDRGELKGEQGKQGEQGEQGQQGNPGPSNVLTIGTVTGGTTASATITGTSPSQKLNLVLPKGEAGTNGTNGKDGAKGADGTSITSVKQTTTSSIDGGTNVVTVELSDGTSSTFQVKNGSKGSAGSNGTNGSNGEDGAEGLGMFYSSNTSTSTSTSVTINTSSITVPSGRSIKVGDLIINAKGNLYRVTSISSSYVYTNYVSSLVGPQGATGKDGINATTTQTATTSSNGLMSYSDKIKLNDIESGANKTTVTNSLTSTSQTNALSANQGKILNDKITDLTPVVLYENSSGSNGTITLSQSASNFKIIEIFYHKNDSYTINNIYDSTKVYSPNGKQAQLLLAYTTSYTNDDNIDIQFKSKIITISGTSITSKSEFFFNISKKNSAIDVNSLTIGNSDEMLTTKVIGYK